MNRKIKAILSIVSTICIVLATTIILGKMPAKTMKSGEPLPINELNHKTLSRDEVPIGIDYDEAVKEGHKVRLYNEEPNIYTVIFQNEDNTRTMYYYNIPVKYLDETGKANDISNKIVKCKGNTKNAYTNKANSTKINFPKDISDGIEFNGKKSINIVPEIVEAAKYERKTFSTPKGTLMVNTLAANVLNYNNDEITISATEEYVDYNNAFGQNTILRYTPLENGIKQDVILGENIGENQFSFLFDFGNQEIIDMKDGGLYVSNPETEEFTGYINPIRVFDTEGKEADNCYYTYEKTETGEWRVTANVNEEFLNSENTVYPVTVDPDYIDVQGWGIKDAVCYKSSPSKNEASATSLYIGKRSSEGVSRLLIGFSNLDITAIDESQMYSAYFSLKDTRCSTTAIDIQAYEYNKSWSESTVTWSSAGLDNAANYGSSPVKTRTISKAEGEVQTHTNRYYFNILSTAKKWCTTATYPSYGFMLKSSTEGSTKYAQFASYEASSNKPTLVFRYLPAEKTVANGTYNFINAKTGLYMDYDSSNGYNVSQNTHDASLSQQYTIEYYQDGYYYIHQQNNSERNLKIEYQDGTTSSNVRTAVANPGSDYQLFRIIKTKYGYRLVPKKYLTQAVQINESDTASGTNVLITAYSKKQYQSWRMQNVVTSLSVSPATASLIVGGTTQASVSITPSAAPKGVTWKSSNSTVATVNSSGLITAKSAGTATITATSTNNSYKSDTCTITVLNKPDLTVSALSCLSGIVGNSATISATVKNVNSTAAASSLAINVKNSAGTSVYSKTLSVASLAANGTKALTTTWTPTTAGTYTITATADSGGAVSEHNESNNTKTITLTILDKPDLTVNALSCTNCIVGNTTPISATVKNVNSTAPASSLAINVTNSAGNSVYSTTLSVASLAANATKALTANWTPQDVGTYTITATADSTNVVAEKSESNDTKTITVEVTDTFDSADGTIDGATNIAFENAETDNAFGSVKSTTVTGHYIYKANDIDYYKISDDNLIMAEIEVPNNVTVSFVEVTEDGENVLATSNTAGKHLKLKTTNNPCYIKVTSATVGAYELNVRAYTEK